MSIPALDCAGRLLTLERPRVMGILNVTPDSFSDGGKFLSPQAALQQARRMLEEGADIIDVGGESTRPGAARVSADEELQRVIPVIEAIRAELSIDTRKPDVMRAAVDAGAGMINDVSALRGDGAVATAAELAVPVCLMHMQGEPQTMQENPVYDNVVTEVRDFLFERLSVCEQAGIPRRQLIIDPGFGFGKQLSHNLQLLHELPALTACGCAVMVGVSRKSMIGAMLNTAVDDRLIGSVSLAALAVWQGASIIRAHDVMATSDAINVVHAVKMSRSKLKNPVK